MYICTKYLGVLFKIIIMSKLKFSTLILFVLFSFSAFSQTTERPTEWKLYKEISGVQFYYKYSECNDYNQGFHREYVLLKLVNTTSTALSCEWDNEMWYAEKCTSCPDKEDQKRNPELHRKVDLIAGGFIEGNCSFSGETTLKIFSKHLNYKVPHSELSGFNLININIYPTE